jgi:hypothetical protein
MAKFPVLIPSHKAIRAYYDALRGLAAQEVEHEQAVRSAFANLLADLGKPLKWTAVQELGKKVEGKRIVPDGTMRDKYQLPRGYWVAKVGEHGFHAQIEELRKIEFPLQNTIFWAPTRAVLCQNEKVLYSLPIAPGAHRPGDFCRILTEFFEHAEGSIESLDRGASQVAASVPKVSRRVAEVIARARNSNADFRRAFASLRDSWKAVHPKVNDHAVDRMFIQHIISRGLMESVFARQNSWPTAAIATQAEKVIEVLAS